MRLYLTDAKSAKDNDIRNAFIGAASIKTACVGGICIGNTYSMGNYVRDTDIEVTFVGAVKRSEIQLQSSWILELEPFGMIW